MFESIRERRKDAKERQVTSDARRRIEVADSDGKLFIAYDGTPVFPIEAEWTTKEIMMQLEILRNNYIRSKMSETSHGVSCF